MSRSIEYDFCMSQFKPAIAALALLLIITLGWTGWHCLNRPHQMMHFQLAAATTAPAKTINVKDKMLHPYWGNCNKCHVTIGAGKPISKVMAAASISIKQTMPHDYWGNCLLCHKVTNGFQAPQRPLARAPAKAAALNQITAQTLGLKLQSVTAAVMQKFGLANEDGVLVLEVAPNSIAYKSGLRPGDEILRAGNVRLDTVNDFERAVNSAKPGSAVKMSLYRGPRTRNVYLQLPKNLVLAAAQTPMTQNQVETMAEQFGVPKTQQAVQQALQQQNQGRAAAAQTPMTQNQVETLAEQFGVPKTQQAVQQALQRQNQGRAAAVLNYGKVAVASTGPGLGYPVSRQFGLSPYFIVYDPAQNNYRVAANPNANDLGGHGIQTGQYMVDLGVSNVVAGSFEPDAVRTLQTMRVNAYAGVTGSVQNALNAYVYHQLAPMHTNPIPQTAVAGVYPYQPYAGGNQNVYGGSPNVYGGGPNLYGGSPNLYGGSPNLYGGSPGVVVY